MIVFLMTGVLMFASIMHYAEKDNFPNIPIAIWWALVTMTTVGYGDKYPVGYIGYGVGCFCVICGVLVIAFTVPIVVNNFSLYYSHAQTRTKLPNKRKQKLKKIRNKMNQFVNRLKADTTKKKLPEKMFSTIPAYTPRGVVTAREPEVKRNDVPKGKPRNYRAPLTVRSIAPVEKTEVEDITSLDSGISPDNKRVSKV